MITDDTIRRIVIWILCAGILLTSICFFVSPKQDFSENENRYLAEMPSLSADSVFSGEYTKSLSDYITDHFPNRDFFMGLKSNAEVFSGRREINHVYVAADDYLIEPYVQPQNTKRIIDTLVKFYEKTKKEQVDTTLMLVPTAVTIYNDKLPAYAPDSNQMETAYEIYRKSGIPAVDCISELFDGAKKGQMYYRTDHHWTTLGAYRGYRAYCEKKGIEAVDLGDLCAQTVTDEFAGTLYSKVNDYSHKKDEITVYTNPEDVLTVTYTDTKEESDSLYNFDYLGKKDKYSLFLDNIHSLIEIENKTAASENVLMLIKDSYANSIVPFLAHHYKKIYVFDTRYYKDGPSSFLADHKEITDILILYNMNTLDNDSGIRGIY